MPSAAEGILLCADCIGGPVVFLLECGNACICEAMRNLRRRKRPPPALIALVLCVLILWASLTSASEHLGASPSATNPPSATVTGHSPPASAALMPQGDSALHSVTAVTIRSQATGRYWQVVGDEAAAGSRLRLVASAPPAARGNERTVFLLEREGDTESGGFILLRWLKTRQLVEAVPPGIVGREEDAWSVRLSMASTVHELHKFNVEEDQSHAQVGCCHLRPYSTASFSSCSLASVLATLAVSYSLHAHLHALSHPDFPLAVAYLGHRTAWLPK